MNFDCDKCIHRSIAEKFMYCKECSTCTNGEVEDTDNHFMPKDFRENTLSEKNNVFNSFVEDIVKAEQKLAECKAYEEHRKNGDITEAVLVCHPKVADAIRNAIYEAGIKKIPMLVTALAEEDKVYMITDKDVIENVRKNAELEV